MTSHQQQTYQWYAKLIFEDTLFSCSCLPAIHLWDTYRQLARNQGALYQGVSLQLPQSVLWKPAWTSAYLGHMHGGHQPWHFYGLWNYGQQTNCICRWQKLLSRTVCRSTAKWNEMELISTHKQNVATMALLRLKIKTKQIILGTPIVWQKLSSSYSHMARVAVAMVTWKLHFGSVSSMIWYFIDVYIRWRILHGAFEIKKNYSLQVLKNISLIRCAH